MSTTSKRVFERSTNPTHEAKQLQRLQNALTQTAKSKAASKHSFDAALQKLGKTKHQW